MDLQKAYDTLDWNFIHDILVALIFPYHFIKIVMTCISTTSYTLLVNGEPFEIFHPKRGLRQGDPMSPLLFVIGMEHLSRMLNVVSSVDSFHFHPRCKRLKLNYLCFADDLLLFSKGEEVSIKLLYQCLDKFAVFSGLYANHPKSAIYLAGVPLPGKVQLAARMNLPLGTLPFRFFGVPLTAKKISAADCDVLID